jgi:prevent-host-death family protein
MAEERVGTHEAKTHLSEYLNRVYYRGERIVIERHGKPVAALVGVEDLARLESAPEDAEERYRRALKEAGIEVTYPTGERVPRKRRLIEVKGKPISEQIIADRR